MRVGSPTKDDHSPKESCLPVSNSHEVWLPRASLRGWGIRSLLRLEFWKHTFFFYSSFCVFDCFEHIYLCPLLLFCWLIPFLLCRLALRWVSSHTATIHAVNTPLLCFHPSKYWVPGVRHFHFQYFYFQHFHFPYFFLLNFSHLLFMLISFSRDPQTALL